MAAYYGLFRGLRSEYAPDTTHKDVVYFATDTQELLMNGTNYGGGSKPIDLSKLDTLNNESACGTYKVVSGGNTLGTLIVNSNAGKTAIYQVLIGGVALSDGKIVTNTSVLNDTIIMRSYVTASKVWGEWSEYLVNSINDLQTQTDANSEAIDTMESQLNKKIDTASVGEPNGIASLDADGKVVAEQLPDNIGGDTSLTLYSEIDCSSNPIKDGYVVDKVLGDKIWKIYGNVTYDEELKCLNIDGTKAFLLWTKGGSIIDLGYRPRIELDIDLQPKIMTYGNLILDCCCLGNSNKGFAVNYQLTSKTFQYSSKMSGNASDLNEAIRVPYACEKGEWTGRVKLAVGDAKIDMTNDVISMNGNGVQFDGVKPHEPIRYNGFNYTTGKKDIKFGASGFQGNDTVYAENSQATYRLFGFKMYKGEEASR